MKLLKTSKELVFHNDDILKNNQTSQVHVVALQMLLPVTDNDKTKVGTKKVMSTDITLKLGVKEVERNGRFYLTPCYMIDECWNGINVYDCN